LPQKAGFGRLFEANGSFASKVCLVSSAALD